MWYVSSIVSMLVSGFQDFHKVFQTIYYFSLLPGFGVGGPGRKRGGGSQCAL